MRSLKSTITCLMCLVVLAGCAMEKKQEASGSSDSASVTHANLTATGAQGVPGADVESRRFIAMRHYVVVETAEAKLPKAWDSVGEFCQSIHGEIISSSIRQKSYCSPPSATLSLRIGPEGIKQLFDEIEKVGTIVEHRTESEDKTRTVIDVEAKIKNLTELRDRLRQILGTERGSLKDLVEVERELSRAQSDLDSLQMRRKALANETEKIAVDISFRSRETFAKTGTFAPIVTACREAGDVLAESVGVAITFIVAVIPWLVLFMPIVWLLIKVFKRLRGKRTATNKA
jgi:hypothetical protein